MLRGVRDKAVSRAASVALRLKFRRWCDMLKIDIDSAAKVLVLEGQPKGETQPLRIELTGYKLETVGQKAVLTWERLTVSREWLTELAKVALPGNRLELPAGTPVELLRAFV
ncbi:hypothetical protein JCM15519_05130 [Fundidesulfovibrio butyratiphilus]